MGTHPIFESDFDCLTEMTIARTTRAGTRNFAREEIKRVKKQLEKVRKWEKKWVVLEECGLKVYRWVPKPMTATEEKEKKDSPLKAALKQNMTHKYAGKSSVSSKDDLEPAKEPTIPTEVPTAKPDNVTATSDTAESESKAMEV